MFKKLLVVFFALLVVVVSLVPTQSAKADVGDAENWLARKLRYCNVSYAQVLVGLEVVSGTRKVEKWSLIKFSKGTQRDIYPDLDKFKNPFVTIFYLPNISFSELVAKYEDVRFYNKYGQILMVWEQRLYWSEDLCRKPAQPVIWSVSDTGEHLGSVGYGTETMYFRKGKKLTAYEQSVVMFLYKQNYRQDLSFEFWAGMKVEGTWIKGNWYLIPTWNGVSLIWTDGATSDPGSMSTGIRFEHDVEYVVEMERGGCRRFVLFSGQDHPWVYEAACTEGYNPEDFD